MIFWRLNIFLKRSKLAGIISVWM